MYWLEVDMSNGKTVRRESQDLNKLYEEKSKYEHDAHLKVHNRKPKPVEIRTGSDLAGHTGTWKL